ncbi:hypothetical protein SADUNF_Sadunf16G0184000 [Salix dunnii]|uniref:CBS domain-containing protein n=1 Tax=Salix dunnii TaxID=1413687 RepID=A0A835MM54_9ROSI|nr:hypothetical protein SADUNF_Sadunf16G0184000 [Salix dunnii]
MASVANTLLLSLPPPLCFNTNNNHSPPPSLFVSKISRSKRCRLRSSFPRSSHRSSVTVALSTVANSVPARSGIYTVGDFMTKKVDLHVVKANTTVDDALEALVEKRITGFPVIDDDYKLVGVVSDYDLLALDSISGGCQNDTNLFPNVDSSWKTFNQLQKLLIKNNGKVVGDLMTPNPLVVYETTNLEDAVKLLLETKYRRLPVVDDDGKLAGIITRGDIVRAALQIKSAAERSGMAPHWCKTRALLINASAGFFLNGIMKGTATISLSRMRRALPCQINK